jgi:hypothetical protein
MSQAITRKTLSDRNLYAGHTWWYEFVSLPRHFSENSVKKFVNRLTAQSARQTKDGYRLYYIQRKHPVPTNLLHMMSEGHVEDFFGSWCNNENKRDQKDGDFNPDENWGIIFDVP